MVMYVCWVGSDSALIRCLVIAGDANGEIAGYDKGIIASGCGFPAYVNGTPKSPLIISGGRESAWY